MYGHNQRRKAVRLLVVAVAATAVAIPSVADAGTRATGNLSATALAPSDVITTVKSTSGRMAQTDPALLGRTDATPVHVVVKLDYDATASYTGDIAGLAATSPKVTGKKLSGKSPAEKAYANYTGKMDADFRSQLAATAPSAKAGQSLQTRVRRRRRTGAGQPGLQGPLRSPASRPSSPTRSTSAAAPTRERRVHRCADDLATDRWPEHLAGKGVIFGDLDTGIWPEHPMLADNPALGTPPAAPSGTAPCVQLRRQPADSRCRRLRVQPQGHRRRSRSWTPTTRSSAARSSPTPPATATATARTPRRRQPATR